MPEGLKITFKKAHHGRRHIETGTLLYSNK